MKCKNCGKPQDNHHAVTKGCPIGHKHRTLGYSFFSSEKFFEPRTITRRAIVRAVAAMAGD